MEQLPVNDKVLSHYVFPPKLNRDGSIKNDASRRGISKKNSKRVSKLESIMDITSAGVNKFAAAN